MSGSDQVQFVVGTCVWADRSIYTVLLLTGSGSLCLSGEAICLSLHGSIACYFSINVVYLVSKPSSEDKRLTILCY